MNQPTVDDFKKMTPEQILEQVQAACERARQYVLARKLGVIK